MVSELVSLNAYTVVLWYYAARERWLGPLGRLLQFLFKGRTDASFLRDCVEVTIMAQQTEDAADALEKLTTAWKSRIVFKIEDALKEIPHNNPLRNARVIHEMQPFIAERARSAREWYQDLL